MKGSFLIKAKEKNVITERGVRVFIMERLLNSSFERGTVFNVDEKTVEVQLEGDETQIREFKVGLEKAIIAKFGNPTILFDPLQINPDLRLPSLMRSGQALLAGQMDKGITVQLKILDSINSLPAKLGKVMKS